MKKKTNKTFSLIRLKKVLVIKPKRSNFNVSKFLSQCQLVSLTFNVNINIYIYKKKCEKCNSKAFRLGIEPKTPYEFLHITLNFIY